MEEVSSTVPRPQEPSSAGGSIQAINLSVVSKGGKILLDGISLSVAKGEFISIIGLSGCGKTTLIRTLCGLIAPSRGTILFSGHEVTEVKKQYPLAVGYIPQFGTFHRELTVREILNYAVALRLPRTVSRETQSGWLNHIVGLARISSLLDQPFGTLSGGQMRRVALAEELIGDPTFLLLDELTTGLDVFSDGEMMEWLRELAHHHGKTILLVTHNTGHLAASDRIAFLHGGKLLQFCGLHELLSAERVSSIETLFGKYSEISAADIPASRSSADEGTGHSSETLQTDLPPSGWLQFPVLVRRQFQLFIRDSGQLWVQALLVILFPLVVAVFALDGLPQVLASVDDSGANIVHSLQARLLQLKNSVESASLVSGLVMFQVILLTLMGANNAAREIARERDILAKELFAGLSPTAYFAAKFSHILILSVIQAFWMTWFVRTVCGFPGSFAAQFAILAATTIAMSTTCLAISAASPSAERASLLAIYLVGFQLPLSGAALALPDWLAEICRPFIAAFWGWSGYLHTLDSTRYFQLVSDSTKTQIAPYGLSLTVLGLHILICAVIATALLKRTPRAATS